MRIDIRGNRNSGFWFEIYGRQGNMVAQSGHDYRSKQAACKAVKALQKKVQWAKVKDCTRDMRLK